MTCVVGNIDINLTKNIQCKAIQKLTGYFNVIENGKKLISSKFTHYKTLHNV